MDGILDHCRAAVVASEVLVARAKGAVAAKVAGDKEAFNTHQRALHALAWYATYAQSLKQFLVWGEALVQSDDMGEAEHLMLQVGFGEYLAQMSGGIPMTQCEIARPHDMFLGADDVATFLVPSVTALMQEGNTVQARTQLATLFRNAWEDGVYGNVALHDETVSMIQQQFRRFTDEQIIPVCHEWHLKDELIPDSVVDQLSELGVFGLTIDEKWGGLGLSKITMCVVTEELSRGFLGLGSLGTRSEIAAELIVHGGTEAQKDKYLPKIAGGEILPTAVFTEPNTGSDLGSLSTRAVKTDDGWAITGNKTWITHASRSDLMALFARTDADEPGYKGLSMFLAEKERGRADDPFPTAGMSGGEIPVLGYRGMKEYELRFENFCLPNDALLGDKTGEGFRQLMMTFESARIQTAARAVGVAQNALEIAHRYAIERRQFNRTIYEFPRVADKLVWMAVETMMARQLTWFAARSRDEGKRTDMEAGMAKLLAARVAWASADNALQIHGGNGYAMEYPISRVLCDARILNIFEGAGEIQSHIIAKGLLTHTN